MIPQLQHVLPYLDEDSVYGRLKHSEIDQLADVCLSASYFLDLGWKEKVLNTAERLLRSRDRNPAMVELRRIALERLYRTPSPEQQVHQLRELSSQFRPIDERSNAHFGEMVLLLAHLLVDLTEHQLAVSVLETFKPRDPHRASRLEQVIVNDVLSIRGQILRFTGDFVKARLCFFQLLRRTPTPPKLTTQLSAVSCELGDFDYAIGILTDEIKGLQDAGDRMDSLNAKRLRLALADAYLMKAIKLEPSQGLDGELVERASGLFGSLAEHFKETDELWKVGKINRFRVLTALAIIEHLQGNPRRALERWDAAQAASRKCWSPGHTDMVIMYSKCELMYRLGEHRGAYSLESEAVRLYQRVGRRYHFTGLGSIWQDHIGNAMKLRGREALG